MKKRGKGIGAGGFNAGPPVPLPPPKRDENTGRELHAMIRGDGRIVWTSVPWSVR